MKTNFSFGMLVLIGIFGFVYDNAYAGNFADPINTPAIIVKNPSAQPMIALSKAGNHFVAVGSRGLAIVSNAAADHWTQGKMPVQSDLDAVQFLDGKIGWAVGQDGVILHSVDGGNVWIKQLDGIQARSKFEANYSAQIKAGNSAANVFLQEIQLNFDQGPTLPWLGVWFTDANTGYVVGPFGDIARTVDGGQSWLPWLEHVQNPNFYNLNAIRQIGGTLFIAGEQGTVYVFDHKSQMFVARPTPYTGSFFGLTGTNKYVIVFGLRGTIYRSTDYGKTWVQSVNPSSSSIMSGTVLGDGRVVLVTVDGSVLTSDDNGKSFVMLMNKNSPLTDVVQAGLHHLLISGLAGVYNVKD